MMAYYRYLVARFDIPEAGIRANDTIEIPSGTAEQVLSVRAHGFDYRRFARYEADGLLEQVEGVLGMPGGGTGAPPPKARVRPKPLKLVR